MSVSEKVRQFITTNFYVADPSALEDSTSFLDRGIIDSTGVLEVVSFIEGEFDVRVEDAEMIPENLDSIGAIVAFVARKKGG
jgi:acyl carrier protein